MQTGEILLVATVVLVLLGGLVALGMGHRRWSIGTVVAAFLVLLSAATFLYLAARVAERDRLWARKIAEYQVRIAKADDDQSPDAKGVFGPAGGGLESLERMRAKRDRWRRGLDGVETWRDRHWDKAAFQPPKDDTSPGRVELPAEGNAEDSPPIGVGSHVFLFDTAPFEEGGAYLGEFLVQATGYDQASKRHVLTVVQTAPRDEYDTKVLRVPHDSVVVYETLPFDRWLAFYRSRVRRVFEVHDGKIEDDDPKIEGLDGTIEVRATGGKTIVTVKDSAGTGDFSGSIDTEEDLKNVPERWRTVVRECVDRATEQPEKEDPDKVRDMLESSPQVTALVRAFVETFRQHEEEVPKDEWPAAKAEAVEKPGTLWAVVEFTKPHTFPPIAGAAEAGAEAAAEEGPKRDYEAGDRAEFDLQTAVALEDEDEAASIERVFRRRPLTDALTLLHTSPVPQRTGPRGEDPPRRDGIRTEGTPTLMRLLQEEIAALERSNERLRTATKAATENTDDNLAVARQLEQDLTSWRRDSSAAADLVAGFERQLDRTTRALAAAEAAIVVNGRELTAALDRLAREIDRVAPPPDRRPAQP